MEIRALGSRIRSQNGLGRVGSLDQSYQCLRHLLSLGLRPSAFRVFSVLKTFQAPPPVWRGRLHLAIKRQILQAGLAVCPTSGAIDNSTVEFQPVGVVQ